MAPIDFSAAHILVVGDVMLDRYWFGDVQRISPEAPVPVVRVRRSEERLGGAANVARNAAVLGARVVLVGVVGDDEPGHSIEALACAVGIECGLVQVGGRTIRKGSTQIEESDVVEIIESPDFQYVSNGAFKLEKAIADFNLDFNQKTPTTPKSKRTMLRMIKMKRRVFDININPTLT